MYTYKPTGGQAGKRASRRGGGQAGRQAAACRIAKLADYS